MASFFSGTRPATAVTHGSATFDLPILYFRDDLFLLFYTADLARVKQVLPSDHLHPVTLPGRKAVVGVGAFNYIETSIGPYGELAVVIPVVYGPKAPPPVLPLVLEGGYNGFGMVVAHLPVTSRIARDAGRGEWGYPKFVADMDFTMTPEYMECRLAEEKNLIMTLRVGRQGLFRRDTNPLVTFTVKDGNLVRTVVRQKGSYRFSLRPAGSFLELGNHPVADFLRDMKLSASPLQSRYYVERSGILPAGEIVEHGVRPLDGYQGHDREGAHNVVYLP